MAPIIAEMAGEANLTMITVDCLRPDTSSFSAAPTETAAMFMRVCERNE